MTRDNFIVEKKNLSTASMRIGFGDSANGCRESKKGLIRIVNGGKIILKGTVGLSQGVVLLVNNSSLVLGDHFRCNYSTTIDCTDENIVFGNDVVLGWNVTVKNNDGHTVIQNGRQKKKADSVYIGNHVWLCSYSTVLKGVNVGNHCVVGLTFHKVWRILQFIYFFGRYWSLQFLLAFHRHILNMNFIYSGPGKHFLYIMTMRC